MKNPETDGRIVWNPETLGKLMEDYERYYMVEHVESWNPLEFWAARRIGKFKKYSLSDRFPAFQELVDTVETVLQVRAWEKLTKANSYEYSKWIYVMKAVFHCFDSDNVKRVEVSGAIQHSAAAHGAFKKLQAEERKRLGKEDRKVEAVEAEVVDGGDAEKVKNVPVVAGTAADPFDAMKA